MKPLDHPFEGTSPKPASPELATSKPVSSEPSSSNPPPMEPVSTGTSKPVLGIARVLLLLVIFSAITAVLSIVADLFTSSQDGGPLGLVAIAVTWVIVLWIAMRWSHVSFGQACSLKSFPIRIVPALILASFGLAIILNELAAWIPGSEVLNKIMQGFSENGGWTWAITGIVVAPLAGGGLLQRTGPDRVS